MVCLTPTGVKVQYLGSRKSWLFKEVILVVKMEHNKKTPNSAVAHIMCLK